ncbi:hypothetical protein NC652_030965 [Populus alba x Populus x berolinensis]|nr:hypothetical protein NC652_030965 [Populus alba x Populus x berolinensis]
MQSESSADESEVQQNDENIALGFGGVRQASAAVLRRGDARERQQQAAVKGPRPRKINLISCGPLAHVSDIKLIRTDTTLDLSQKAEKGMSFIGGTSWFLYLSFWSNLHFFVDVGRTKQALKQDNKVRPRSLYSAWWVFQRYYYSYFSMTQNTRLDKLIFIIAKSQQVVSKKPWRALTSYALKSQF